MTKIALTTPIYITNPTLKDCFQKFIDSIKTKHELCFIPVINLCNQVLTYPENTYEIQGRQPQGVAKAWNDGIKKSWELDCKYCMVTNQDVILNPLAIDNLIDFMEANNDIDVGSMTVCDSLDQVLNSQPTENTPNALHWSDFIVRPDIFEKFGEFDENFMPSYFDDNDFGTRVTLADGRLNGNNGSLFWHENSATIKHDEALRNQNSITFEKNKQYFISKWGREPCGDRDELLRTFYHHPYNEEDKDLKYWRK
jgi:GT2 family glycosyltransferase